MDCNGNCNVERVSVCHWENWEGETGEEAESGHFGVDSVSA